MKKPDCSNHPTKIDHFGDDWNKLAEQLGDLHYAELSKFFLALHDKIRKDERKDFSAGRTQLACALFDASKNIRKAFDISRPYMNKSSK